jgi:tetratricopeptide (TPR) repeat protein
MIEPADFSKKHRSAQPKKPKKRILPAILVLAAVVLLIILCVFWMLHYLASKPADVISPAETPSPRTATVPDEAPEAVETIEGTARENGDPVKLAANAKKAEQMLAAFTLMKNDLEEKGVSQWGGTLYAQMIQASAQADGAFLEKKYAVAFEKYTDASRLAKNLVEHIDEAFQKTLDEGNIALDEGNGDIAQQKFEVALMIDPSNKSVRHQLDRAKNIGTVMELLASGRNHEENGNLAFAHADYQQALNIDPEFEKANAAFARVKKGVQNTESQQLVSEGLAAYHNKDYQLAKRKLVKAKALKPKSQEIRNVLSQIEQAILLERIESLEKVAVQAEKDENWQQALKSYMAVLAIDKNVQFASRGKERSLQRIEIEKRIGFFLQNPKALESNSQLKNAIMLIQEVENTQPKGPRLMAQIKDLTHQVKLAQTPIKVTIESDNLTEVAIYKVGKLGRFAFRELDLRPGTYTVVGARDGYKDVRQKMVVKPGQGPLRLSVKCRVKI